MSHLKPFTLLNHSGGPSFLTLWSAGVFQRTVRGEKVRIVSLHNSGPSVTGGTYNKVGRTGPKGPRALEPFDALRGRTCGDAVEAATLGVLFISKLLR